MTLFDSIAGRATAVVAVSAILAMAQPFSRGLARMSDTASEPRPGDLSPLRIRLVTDRATYAPGDTINARLTVSLRGARSVTLRFGTSQRCDFEILDEGGATVWRWAADRMFAQMLGNEVLRPGHRELVCREGFAAPRSPGRYRIVGSLVAHGAAMTATAGVTVR